jgi:hypothetical protein
MECRTHQPTFEADGFKVGHSRAGPQIEEVVVRVLDERLALVPVVVHVEPLAPGIVLALFGALAHNASVPVAKQPLGARTDELVAGSLLKGHASGLAAALCKDGPALS